MELLIQQLEGAFACAFKSRMFPGEIVCTRRGSPLLVGIKTENDDLATDSIPIQYRYVEERVKELCWELEEFTPPTVHR